MTREYGGPFAYYYIEDEGANAIFVRRCPHCGRIVKAKDSASGIPPRIIARGVCSKHGSVEMNFIGY